LRNTTACLTLLWPYRKIDVNMSSTFECSRNDILSNIGVLLAAAGVAAFDSPWPDIAVGAIIAAIFFRSAFRVLSEAWPQFRAT
jgi:Co/Zn/Cd efflux system component